MKIDIINMLGFSLLFVSCSDITMLGHVAAYDVNAEFKGSPLTPASLNAGFESHSFVAVPHAHSLTPGQYAKSDFLPVGDVLPTLSKLKIEGIQSTEAWNGVAFDFICSGATGDAAIAAAGGSPEQQAANPDQPTLVDKPKADNITENISEISKDESVIPVR
jgi:hypothetical protein